MAKLDRGGRYQCTCGTWFGSSTDGSTVDGPGATEGLRGNGDFRSRAGHRGVESAAGCHRGTAAGPETGGGQRRVDPRLLGLGRRAKRFPLGQRRLAHPAARPPMGARVLGQINARLSMDIRLLGQCQGERGGILARAAATVEVGPNIAASSADQTWLPGCWVWQQNRYAWRPGFWATVQPDWVWVPAHYVWAPRGYVFVDGYWDYSIGRRGVLFAPVYFNRGHIRAAGFLLLTYDGDRPGRIHQSSFHAAAISTLLFW